MVDDLPAYTCQLVAGTYFVPPTGRWYMKPPHPVHQPAEQFVQLETHLLQTILSRPLQTMVRGALRTSHTPHAPHGAGHTWVPIETPMRNKLPTHH